MSVSFRCGCGQQLEVEDEHAGQPVECPTCQQVVTAPRPTPTLAKRAVRPASAAAEYEVVDEPTKPASQPKRWATDDEDDDEPARPRRKKRSADDLARARHLDKPKPKHGGWFGTESWILSGGVVGGLIAMLIAVVWFVLGLLADRIFFYPPILFVVGLVGLVRGVISRGQEDD